MGERDFSTDRLKVAWVTPLAGKSAIGRYSRLVLAELKHHHDVEAWAFGPDEQGVNADVPVRLFETYEQAVAELDSVDIAVYHIGNNWPFHAEILLTALARPGVVVLHDQSLQHLMAVYCFEYLRDPDAYVRLMRESHGSAAAEEATAAIAGERRPVWESDDATAYPLTPAVARNALGVVSHSTYALRLVLPPYVGPSVVLPLPYMTADTTRAVSRDDLGISAGALLVITTGHMNPNKRVKEVVQALGKLPQRLRGQVIYALLGPVEPWYSAELMQQAEAAGLTDQVRLEGYIDDSRLYSYITHADLCVNLRYPNYEAASASLIEQLLAGKAVITSSTGFFAEIPDDVVVRVGDTAELPEILTNVLSNRELREDLAARALRFARGTFRADQYSSALSMFLQRVVREAPVRHIEQTLRQHVSSLGLSSNDPYADRLCQHVRSIFLSAW